jgi:F-type H+-transporting ATPase subunit d
MVTQVEDVGAAHPRITEAVETMIKKGKWTVPGTMSAMSPFLHNLNSLFAGYKEKFGDLSLV